MTLLKTAFFFYWCLGEHFSYKYSLNQNMGNGQPDQALWYICQVISACGIAATIAILGFIYSTYQNNRRKAEIEAERDRRRMVAEEKQRQEKAKREEIRFKKEQEERELKRKQELEKVKQFRVLEEKRRKQKEEQEQKRLLAEIEERRRKEEQDRAAKLDDHQHEQEIIKIQGTERANQRKDELLDKQAEREHTRQLEAQNKILDITQGLFSKVEPKSTAEAAYAACIVQSIQPGQTVDKDLLQAVSSKVPTASPMADIASIVENVIQQAREEDVDGLGGRCNYGSNVIVSSRD